MEVEVPAGVDAGDVCVVAGDVGFEFVGVGDGRCLAGREGGDFFALLLGELVAVAVVAAVLAGAGELTEFVVQGAVETEFDGFLVAAAALVCERVGRGFVVEVFVRRDVFEAAVHQLPGCGHPVAGLEVFKLALHRLHEEDDDGPAVVGLLADHLGEFGANAPVSGLRFALLGAP